MLGSALVHFLGSQKHVVVEANRRGMSITGRNQALTFNAEKPIENQLDLRQVDIVINAIGMIRQLIDEKSAEKIQLAFQLNSSFPQNLNSFGMKTNTPIIQIGTDCVFSGTLGAYTEVSSFDPVDVYGLSKVEGELGSTNSVTLRCSIVGKELKSTNSLLSWVISQPTGATLNGYTNHFWNGISTLHFSKIVNAIIQKEMFNLGTAHVVPRDKVSKYELIRLITSAFGRSDLKVVEHEAPVAIDRTLATVNSARNASFWQGSGYSQAPSIEEMVDEFAEWRYS
jgi:dTDP-4-dehydrorhamnose reductase